MYPTLILEYNICFNLYIYSSKGMAKSKPIIIEMAKLFVMVSFTIFMVMMPNNPSWVRAHTPDHESNPIWAKTTMGNHEKTTMLEFYFHDKATGDFPTVVEVVPAPNSTHPFTGFGYISVADDPLTVEPDPDSKPVGRFQGLFGSTSKDGTNLIMAVTLNFSDGMYNGSSISILAMNKISQPVREFPVTGGTGLFRMARGYAIARTYSLDPTAGIAVVGYNVTLFH